MGTKLNPGPFDCYVEADDDEPIFVLRAKDPLAPLLVRAWAGMRRGTTYGNARELTKRGEAMECADACETWPPGMASPSRG